MTEFKNADDEAIDVLGLHIQRLVDGELADSDTTSLLRELESSDDGWRRCALAFVESQVWNESVGAIDVSSPVNDEVHANAGPTAVSLPAVHADDSRVSYTQLAWLAASLLLAFVLGRQLSPENANNLVAEPQESSESPVTNGRHVRVGVKDRSPKFSFDTGQELGEVTMRVGGANDARTVTLPVFAGSPGSEATQSSPLPDLIRQLRGAGIDIQHTISLQPVEVGDEGVMFIPVERVDFSRRPQLIP